MKKVLFIAVVFTLLLQVPAFAETKIGVASIQHIVMNCDYGKDMAQKLKAKFEPLKKEIEREAAGIKKLENELKNQDLALKLEAKQDRQREYRRRVRDHQDSVVAFRQKFQSESQKQQQPILERVSKVIAEYGKANKYSMIIEMSKVVMYVADGIDITDDIVAELNKLKKAGK